MQEGWGIINNPTKRLVKIYLMTADEFSKYFVDSIHKSRV